MAQKKTTTLNDITHKNPQPLTKKMFFIAD